MANSVSTLIPPFPIISPMSEPVKPTPVRALQQIVQNQVTGRLTIRIWDEGEEGWRLYVGQGQLHYATSIVGERERLIYVLNRIQPQLSAKVPDSLPLSAYAWLHSMWKDGTLSLSSLRTVLQRMSQEALIHMFSLPQGTSHFDRNLNLDPILIAIPLKDAIAPVHQSVKLWQSIRPQILSPFQRLELSRPDIFQTTYTQLAKQLCGPKHQLSLADALAQKPCLYELATQLDLNLLSLAKNLQPLIANGVLNLQPYISNTQIHRPTIACIDDSITIQQAVKVMLEVDGYRVVSITDPLKALASLLREKPDLVFLDITMPDLDGYNLCKLLRQHEALKETPIVMLTGRDGMVDKVRARFVGATSYVTKPFDSAILTEVIAKYVG